MLTNSVQNDEEYLVEVKDFSKVYFSDKKSFYACKSIDFTAQKGITGILGLNGAGKSTLLKAICGIHYATEGSVKAGGYSDINLIRRCVGFVPEYPLLDSSLTVKETLFMEAFLHGLSKEDAKKYIEQAVELCSLKDVYTAKVLSLSKGFQQRTSFAKALSFNPKILVLDEFTGGLDPSQIVSLRKNIVKLSREKNIILSTHYIEQAAALCGRIYIIDKGSVRASGSIDEIIKLSGKSNLEEAFLSLTDSQ